MKTNRSTPTRFAPVILLCLFCGGCATYKQSSLTPDGMNYTISVDHKTGDQTSYFGLTWNLKP